MSGPRLAGLPRSTQTRPTPYPTSSFARSTAMPALAP